MNQDALDRLLTATAAAVVYPATPDVTSRVAGATAAPPARSGLPRLAPAYILVALLIALGAALALNSSRDAIARLFGVEGSTIEVVPAVELAPTIAANQQTAPTPASPMANALTPGQSVTLEEIPALAGFEAALPGVEDERIASTLIVYGTQAVVAHRYPSFHLWQTKLPQTASFGKFVTEDSIMKEVSVNGADAVWLSGGEHLVRYVDENGEVITGSARTVSHSTLIWRTDAFFYRIETDLPLEDALRIAATLP